MIHCKLKVKVRKHPQNSNFGSTTATLAHFLRRVFPFVGVIVIDAIAVIVVVIRLQRFKPLLKVRGKSRPEFTNVFKSFQTALRQVLLSFLLEPSALNLH